MPEKRVRYTIKNNVGVKRKKNVKNKICKTDEK